MSRRLEKSLQVSFSQLPRADLTAIIDTDITRLKEHDYITRQEYSQGKGIISRLLFTIIFSAFLTFGICLWLLQSNSINTIVTLDIDAGFTLTANDKGEVLRVKGVDEAALNILHNIDYTGAGITDVTNILISRSALRHYPTNNNHYILISVWDRDRENAQNLLSEISVDADLAAKSAQIAPEIIGQYLEMDKGMEQNAEHLGITAGRLQLVEIVLKYRPSYTTEQLAGYSIENLLNIARAADIPLPVNGYQAVGAARVSGNTPAF